jgi:hypothetical protein
VTAILAAGHCSSSVMNEGRNAGLSCNNAFVSEALPEWYYIQETKVINVSALLNAWLRNNDASWVGQFLCLKQGNAGVSWSNTYGRTRTEMS